jgi:cytochrome c biogenesis protein CcdA
VNDGLGIPFELQSHLATFVRDARLTVFEGHVPGALVRESLALADRPERLLLHQDSMGGAEAYGAWAFGGAPQHYPMETPLSVYSTWVSTNGGGVREPPSMLPLVLGTGFVDGLNPCAFAVLLFFISFLFVSRRPRVEIARIGLLYIFAVFLAYLLIGLGLLMAITVSEDPHLIARVAGVLVIGLGAFVLFQPFMGNIPNPFHTPRIAWEAIRRRMFQGTQPAAAGAGFLVGLCTFPCSGGIYVAVIGLLAAQTTYWEGLGYLYLYNVAFVLPLVLILAAVSNKALAKRTTSWERRHTDAIRQASGVAMILVGLLTLVLA